MGERTLAAQRAAVSSGVGPQPSRRLGGGRPRSRPHGPRRATSRLRRTSSSSSRASITTSRRSTPQRGGSGARRRLRLHEHRWVHAHGAGAERLRRCAARSRRELLRALPRRARRRRHRRVRSPRRPDGARPAGDRYPNSVLLLLTDGLTPDQREVARGAYEVTTAMIPFVGGSSGDNLTWDNTSTFGDGRVLRTASWPSGSTRRVRWA